MRAPLLALVALAGLLPGCALPGLPDCGPHLATMTWTEPGLYEALGAGPNARIQAVVEDVLRPGLPLDADELRERWPRHALREVRWSGAAQDAAGGVHRGPGDAEPRVSFAFDPGDDGWRDALDGFLAALVDAPPEERARLAAALEASREDYGATSALQATTALPLRLDALYAELRAQGAPREDDLGLQVQLAWPAWTFVVDVPARIATFPNDSNGWTETTEDDGLPYFRLHVTPSDEATLLHGEGQSRFGFGEADAMRWLNETFPAAGLPGPTFRQWRADYATCE